MVSVSFKLLLNAQVVLQHIYTKQEKELKEQVEQVCFARSRSIEGAKSIQELARLPQGGTVQCVRCQVCTKTNQHTQKQIHNGVIAHF